MKLKTNIFRLIILIFLFTIACNNDNDSEEEPEQETFLCCGENPFSSDNVNNLDQSAGEISVFPLLTANGDATNDYFWVNNLELYDNNSVTLYDLNDNVIFSTDDYGIDNLYGGILDIDDTSLKYKVVVENEQTFVEFGYVCVITGIGPDDTEFSFFNECDELGPGFFDPAIAF